MGTITTINSTIDYETAQLLADEYECEVELISLFEQTVIEDSPPKEDVLFPRPPVVTVMGHVDHGKTTLLDVLRGTNVADNEHGNITQHIGAYQIKANNSNASLITMLDTPGHFAFSKIRSRGAKLTDLIVLVVAVDDGVKPQTEESIKLALETDTPVIVALNKIDLPDYDEEKVFEELSEHNVLVEEWGGTVPVCRISALKKIGIENLLEHILFQAEVMELKASSKARARGTILESKVEKGRGPVLTVLIENGILRVGDPFVAGVYYGKVRSIYNDRGESIKEVMSGTPVEVVGVEESPSAGEPFQVTESEKVARQISINRQELDRHTASENVTKVTTDTLYSTIEADQIDYYNVIIKGDVHSSVEAVKNSLLQLGNNEVAVKVIQASTGSINENDIRLAAASNADVIGFNIKPASKVSQLAVQEKVTIKKYNLIHDIHEAVKDKLNEKLQPSIHEEQIAEIEVRELFKISKVGTIAGAMVLDGKAEKKAIAKVFRNNTELVTGTISSLKRNKDDVNSVEKGFECGVGISNFNDFQVGDIIQVYKTVSVKRTI